VQISAAFLRVQLNAKIRVHPETMDGHGVVFIGEKDRFRMKTNFTVRGSGTLIRVIFARDMPYQSLIKAWLSEDAEERRRAR
jgi:hypothetical protein